MSCLWSHPPPSDDYVARPAWDAQYRVGDIRALPNVQPQVVMRDMRDNMHLHYLPRYQPRQADTWQQVERVMLEPQPDLNVAIYIDLRISIWEKYEYPRVMSVIQQGRHINTIVIPESLDMQQAQERVNRAHTPQDSMDVIRALDEESWVFHREALPAYIVSAMRDLAELDQHYQRGGARPYRPRDQGVRDVMEPPPTDRQ